MLANTEQQGWPGAAGQPRIICPGCTRRCLFPGLEGEASAQHPVPVPLRLSVKTASHGDGDRPCWAREPRAPVGLISPAGFL